MTWHVAYDEQSIVTTCTSLQAKMDAEGVNRDYLDKDPTELVPLDDTPKAAAKNTPIKKQPKVNNSV
jgi:hypothetical protein